MIDVHCHLQFGAFEKDYDETIKRAFEAGVTKIINVGTQISSSEKAIELARTHKHLYAIVGIHPHHADKLEPDWYEKLSKLAMDPKVVAIGECGMDFYNYKSNGIVNPQTQQEVFERQIELALNHKLPLQVHNRHAGKKTIEILRSHKNQLLSLPGMFHCFAGNMDVLKAALDLGFYIGFDGNVTYKGLAPKEDTSLRDLATYVPMDRIVVETDSPYLAPIPHRGGKNEPSYVIITARFLAKLKGVSFEKFQDQTTKNAQTIFNLR